MNCILSVKFPFRLYSLLLKYTALLLGLIQAGDQRAVRNTAGALLTTHSMAGGDRVRPWPRHGVRQAEVGAGPAALDFLARLAMKGPGLPSGSAVRIRDAGWIPGSG